MRNHRVKDVWVVIAITHVYYQDKLFYTVFDNTWVFSDYREATDFFNEKRDTFKHNKKVSILMREAN